MRHRRCCIRALGDSFDQTQDGRRCSERYRDEDRKERPRSEWRCRAGSPIGFIGLALYEALGHRIRPLFFSAVIPGAVSVALVRRVREPKASPNRPAEGDDKLAQRRVMTASLALLPARYWQLLPHGQATGSTCAMTRFSGSPSSNSAALPC